MARGTARFDGQRLRDLRKSREVDGGLLSAAELARRLGTSKARVLAYETSSSVPEPRRIQQIAHIFKVEPKELTGLGPHTHDLRSLRTHAGMTAAELAERIGVSRNTYRRIESQALLPTRNDGAVSRKLANALGLPLRDVHRALDQHPAAAQRRTEVAGLLEMLFQRAHEKHKPAVVDLDEDPLLRIAALVSRPVTVVSRLVNYELGVYRSLVKQREALALDQAYAQSAHALERAQIHSEFLDGRISQSPVAVASALVRFLAEAMTSQQWRVIVQLFNATIPLPRSLDEFAREAEETWHGLIARGYLRVRTSAVDARNTIKWLYLTPYGRTQCRQQATYYACLYPRIPAPRTRGLVRPRWDPEPRNHSTVSTGTQRPSARST